MNDILQIGYALRKLSPTYWVVVLPERLHRVFRLGYQERTGIPTSWLRPLVEDMTPEQHHAYRHGVDVAADRLAQPNWKEIAVVLDWEG